MALNQQKVEELLGLFKQRYPHWTSFSEPVDPDFQKDEIDYKQRLVVKVANQLAESDLKQLINANDYDALGDFRQKRHRLKGCDENIPFG
jgi:hypothetical protein